jgi:hypothetical protein
VAAERIDSAMPRSRADLAALAVFALASAAGDAARAQARLDPALVKTLCAERTPCKTASVSPAGRDAAGVLVVVELDLGTKPKDGDEPQCRPYRREFWLIAAGRPPVRIFDFCNDGYGAAGVGEDEVKIAPNRVTHARVGGSAWRWEMVRTLRLSPLAVTAETSCSYHTLSMGFVETRWDWTAFRGEILMRPRQCADDAKGSLGCAPAEATRRSLPIPALTLAPEALAGTRHLGSCALVLDESGQRGRIVHGRPKPGGAELRVLMAGPATLVVTVIDRDFATGGATWVHDDHLEIWTGAYPFEAACEKEHAAEMRQWSVRLADGRVDRGHGAGGTPPSVLRRTEDRLGERKRVTLVIDLGKISEAPGLVVAFSKAENGRQARMVATAAVRRGDGTTLGLVKNVDGGARCTATEGVLDLVESGSAKLALDD